MTAHTVVIGGGLAGLAAAVALAERGLRVTLCESRPRLGGRASSFVDRTTGEVIDNCQHVSLGCCTNLAHFCATTGLSRYFRREPRLNFISPEGTVNAFAAGRLPAPLHLLPAFWRLDYLTLREKWRLARGLRALARERDGSGASQSFARWLEAHGQTARVIERFWQVVLVSALSESLDRIEVAAARKVFVDAFLAHRDGWEMLVPTVPLDELYGARLLGWLQSHGANVRLAAGVERLEIDGDRISSLTLRSGESMAADWFVLAVPQQRLFSVLPGSLRDHPQLAGVSKLESAPISSVHLWFDQPIMELPHAVLVGRLSQWVFNRSALQGTPEGSGSLSSGESLDRYAYQVVISASHDVAQRPSEETMFQVVGELQAIWPQARAAKLVHWRLVTEHAAVFAPLPESGQLRPIQQSPIANLQLAGDWTQTGWPATMEGAVRSGYLAAENILKGLSRPARVLQPDLPVAFLSRVLLGL